MRLVLKKCRELTSCLANANKNYLRHVKMPFSNQVAVLDQDTLTGRILLYLNKDTEQSSDDVRKNVPNTREHVNNLRKLSTDAIIQFLNKHVTTTNPKSVELIRKIDKELCLRLRKTSPEDTFKLLHIYMKASPGRIRDMKFYQHSLDELYSLIHKLNKNQRLQLIFYLGLQKKRRDIQEKLKHCSGLFTKQFVEDLTIEEICIICNSFFKTSTKIKSTLFLDRVKTCVNENIWLLKDPALFITLVKTLRHNHYQDEDVLETISCGIIFNKTYPAYSFSALCHIMALYADYSSYYDEKLFTLFTKLCMDKLEQSTFTAKQISFLKQLRGKDITRFLWIMSVFNELKLLTTDNLHSTIVPKLMDRNKAGEFNGDVDSIISAALYIWMLDYKPYELLSNVLSTETAAKIIVNSKTPQRLNTLLHAIQIEDEDFFASIPLSYIEIPDNFSYQKKEQLQVRPLLKRVINLLSKLRTKLNLDRFEVSQEVPVIQILGITGYRGDTKAVLIEILDDFSCISNVENMIPMGLMSLKLRLLEYRIEGFLVINEKEVQEMSDRELLEYLTDELQLIC